MSVADFFNSLDYGMAPESDRDARAWLKTHEAGFGHFIGGAFAGGTGSPLETRDPSTGAVLGRIAAGTPTDVEKAVLAARKAQGPWEKLGGHGRARHLYALARAVQRHARLLAVVESLDNGKPIRESRDIDIPLVVRHFYHHAGWAQLQESEFRDFAPVGVVGQITPWNFPLLMLAWKVAPALAMGNTVVLKPAEFTSLTALLFAQIAAQAGLPPGVLNVVTGTGVTGGALVAHEGVNKIAFTGSTEVGKLIREQTAGTGKSLTLELGGKSPFIVFEDADLDSAIEGVVDAIWLNQGQVCCAGSRLLLQEGIAPEFIKRLKRRMAALRVGSPLDKSIDIGAIVDEMQRQRIDALVKAGVEQGAEIFQPELSLPSKGCFYLPTLLTHVGTANIVASQEIFGPVIAAMTFRTPDEAIALANNSRYGLAASIWSESIGLAMDVAAKVCAGVVWVNAAGLFDASVGFGGCRESGFGREGGREGLYEYLKPKALTARKPRPAAQALQRRDTGSSFALPALDRTPKLFIGGKQARPDSGYSRAVLSPRGVALGEVGEGSRKDIRNAVSAARGAAGWTHTTAHHRAQVIYYIAENLSARERDFAARIAASTGVSSSRAEAEVQASIVRLFSYGAWADKFEGTVHVPPLRGAALAMNEALGVVGVICPDEAPLLSFVSLVAPLIAMGNRVVALPSEAHPLIATDFYSVLETSDVPGGVINIITGPQKDLARTLAEHEDVDGLWAFSTAEISALVEKNSTGNLKRTFVDHGLLTDWSTAEGPFYLRQAVQVKNIWIPYGE